VVALRHIVYRRAIRIYVVAIVLPALVLLYLGLKSVQRQRDAINALLVSNLRLSGEKLASELEHRTAQLADACLREAAAVNLRTSDGRQIRLQFERLREQHPIAGYFFLLEGNSVRYPALRTPPPRQLEAYAMSEDPAAGKKYVALFREAEDQELRLDRPEQALAGYRRCYELPTAASLKALALSRMARCFRKVGRPGAAEQAYRTLLENYGDLFDLSHRPYALAAGFELEQTPARHAQLYRDLVRGRWELSAEQVNYFLSRLVGSEPVGGSDYLGQFEFARALEAGFRHRGPLRSGEVSAYALAGGQGGYQTYYTLLPAGAGRDGLLGFAVNLKWWEQSLLPQCRARLAIKEEVVAVWKSGPGAAPPRRADAEVPVALPGIFPFLDLSLSPAPGATWSDTTRRGFLVYTGSTVLIVAVLIMGILLLTRDVSRESQLNQFRSDFVSAVSHELKTPLTLIRLYGETLSEGEGFPDEDRRGFYQIITREAERLTHLIDKVLTFARIESGQKQYHLQEGDLGLVVARTLEAYRQYLKQLGFSLTVDLAADLPLVRFDPDAVSQALLNLLDNAVKYSGDSTEVNVRLRALDGKVILEVEDHGIGIPPKERQKVFEQFYRVSDGAAKGGYGLGLFLVRHIMDAHGGSIEIESGRGEGSRFRLVFPALPELMT
jgi:signal transduction histidine kinase